MRNIAVRVGLGLVLSSSLTACADAPRGKIIAHRGASWYLPEHTLEGYALAYAQGADVIEPDVVLTRDNVAVCAHDLTMEAVCDVAEVYPDRSRADGKWYWIDFDLAELKGLRRFGRKEGPSDGYQLCTFDEMLAMVRRLNGKTGRSVWVMPEMKDPAFHAGEGKDLAGVFVATLARHGYTGADDGALVQCFQLDALEALHAQGCGLPLTWALDKVPDAATLARARAVCVGLVPKRTLVEDGDGRETGFARECRALGLALYPYTFDSEPAAVRRFLGVHHVAGVFSNDPAVLEKD